MEHIFCPECGFKNEIKNKFCPGCGNKLSVNTEELVNLSNDKDDSTSIENKTTGKEEDFLFEEKYFFPRVAQGLKKYADVCLNSSETIEEILEKTNTLTKFQKYNFRTEFHDGNIVAISPSLQHIL
jgi:uncharacterized Zn finger protein (UPF0148 family)